MDDVVIFTLWLLGMASLWGWFAWYIVTACPMSRAVHKDWDDYRDEQW